MAERRMRLIELVLIGMLGLIAFLIVGLMLSGCVPAPVPTPDYQATIAAVETASAYCADKVYLCETRPTQTPHVIVVTPVSPTLVPVTATPPYPSNLVSCKDAPLGTRIYATNGATLRYWHSKTSNNLGQAYVGTWGMLIDKAFDDNHEPWYREQGMRTNDFPYGTKDGEPMKAWIGEYSSGCVPPK